MGSTFHIFTDGSVIGNPGCGGWAAVLISGDKSWEMSGSSPWTTISEMELTALLAAGLSSDSDRYLWSDLCASKLSEAVTSRSTTQNDEHQAVCAALEMQQFGEIACDSNKIAIAAEELSPFVNQHPDAVLPQLQRLIATHADEWQMFRASAGPQSFINQWLDILK